MITKRNKFVALEGHEYEIVVSHLVSLARQMDFLRFRNSIFSCCVLSHEIETPTFRKLGFLVTISLALHCVPTHEFCLVDQPR